MTMIIVLPAAKGDVDIIADKISRLQQGFQLSCQLLVHAPKPRLKRAYFFNDQDMGKAQAQFQAAVDTWLGSLQARLATLAQSIEIVSDRDVHKSLVAAAKKHSPSFVVLYNHRLGLQDDYKKAICQLNVPVLMMREQPWAQVLKVLAAIDPLHERDDKPLLDVSVVEQASRWARKLVGSIEVLHACFVPPYISEYKTQIRRIHNDAVNNFMTDYGFKQLEYAVQNGSATTVVLQYSKDHAIDLVVAGGLSRSFFERAVIGSTTEQLLQTMACDILLLPKL